jgi:GntR family transcriptional regulator
MGFEFTISSGSLSPIFKQIVDQVRLAAMTGRLPAGTQLPSVRALAEQLLVNPNTVARAYGELAREGIIDSQPGRGVYVAAPRQMYTKSERLRRLAPLIESLVNEGLSLGMAPKELLDALEQRLGKLKLLDGRPTS